MARGVGNVIIQACWTREEGTPPKGSRGLGLKFDMAHQNMLGMPQRDKRGREQICSAP